MTPLYIALILALILLLVWLYWFRRNTVSALTAADEYSDRKFLDLDGLKVGYRQVGSGRDLVLVHGIGASNFIWRFIAGTLARRFKVTAIDLPGFGDSDKNTEINYDLESQAQRLFYILDRLEIKEAFLVGSSMGGTICLRLAQLYPKSFQKLVLLAPATDSRLVTASRRFLLPALPKLGVMLTPRSMELILQFVLVRKELIHPESIEEYFRPYRDKKAAIASFVAAVDTLKDHRMPDLFKNHPSKVLILWGAQDRMVPEKYMQDLVTLLPQASLATHTNAGHHPMEDEPEWVSEQILKFLE